MELKNYQKLAVAKLLKVSKKLLDKKDLRFSVFKAPTGSGKTIILADFLKQLASQHLRKKYAFLWISGNNLHQQSRDKLERYLSSSRYTFSYLEDVQNNEIKENEVVFVNWHSLTKRNRAGDYINIFMRHNESERNLKTFIDTTKQNGIDIILIVDESHYHYWSEASQDLVKTIIAPKLTIEVSATPKMSVSNEDLANEEAGYISVKFDDVVAEGMIKTEVVVNEEIGKFKDFHAAADDVIIQAALAKQAQLQALCDELKVPVKPLVLIQLPSESESMSALDTTKLEFVQKKLREKHDITIKNGRLAIWLSDRHENIERITENNNTVQVLIFKQAIALGWDCPRAQILVMFRDIQEPTFKIQTVGRIMRTPEAQHYQSDLLDRAYVYTNLPQIIVDQDDKDALGYFAINPSHRIEKYTPLDLPSVYLSRIDFGDLTLSFRKLFIDEANRYFNITSSDTAEVAKRKADEKLDLEPQELTQEVISDAVFSDIDNTEEIVGQIVHFTVPEDDLKYRFELFAKLTSLPYAPVRSHTKIQQAIYDWFDDVLGYVDVSRLEVQRIVVCSEKNQRIFRQIIESAKQRFEQVAREEQASKQTRKDYPWNVPSVDYFNEQYDKHPTFRRSVLQPCYLRKDRSAPEQDFEKALEHCKRVKWWYKNGVSRESYFAIPYQDSEDVTRAFYPDYVVQFTDGSIAIFDTKSGITAESPDTKMKSDALQAYLATPQLKKKKARGGIVISTKTGFHLFTGDKYTTDMRNDGWQRLEL